MTPAWLQKASDHLEWPRLVAAVLARCHGDATRRLGLSFASDRADAERLLAETRETCALLARGERFPLQDLRDIEPHLARLERQGALKAAGLHDVLCTLETARRLRAFLGSERSAAPRLFTACSTDPSLDALEDDLRAALESDGTLSDRASAELKALRTEIANLRERIVGRLQQLIERHDDVLSDRYYTLRDGRYVLPVRRDAHERVQGIVHGISQSGASVFVEPRAVLAHGNRLKMAESALEREEERVLAALSSHAAEYLPSLRAAADAICRMDLRLASATLGRDFGGSVPELCAQSEIDLDAARHPLLALDGVDAVPNRIVLRAGQGLVISGPNASGKTVLLKTLGLAALMARHGLPIAADEGSRIGYFERVLTDVGDEQSTAKNLSTFSAHVTNLKSVLEAADEHALVLLDELATGTDPHEGAALACAIVDALCNARATLVVTTHYEPLKAFSLRDPRLRSASVGFDVERMEPNFSLTLDVPGVSSALLVAKRFGLPQQVLDFAERVLPEQARDFERLVRELAQQTTALRDSQAEVQRELARLKALRSEESERLERLRKQGDAQIAREVERLQHEVRTARTELGRIRALLKSETLTRPDWANAERSVAAIAARVALGGDLAQVSRSPAVAARPALETPDAPLQPGMRVHVARLRADAVVIEGASKGRVRVAVGPLKLWVDRSDLSLAAPEAALPIAATSPAPSAAPAERGHDNTVNVRGMRVDDALTLIETFIDRLYTTESRVGYVLHGHGTGALRDAVRKHLKVALPHIRDSRPADASEGGDAVTVFYLD